MWIAQLAGFSQQHGRRFLFAASSRSVSSSAGNKNASSAGLLQGLFGRLMQKLDREFKLVLTNPNLMMKKPLQFRRTGRHTFFSTQLVVLAFGKRVVKSRDILLSAACVSVYNWDEKSVAEQQLTEYTKDLELTAHLTLETLTCKSCHQRIKVDQKIPDVSYCTCSDGKALNTEVDGWKPFIERPNTLVWRKEHEVYKGLYTYKMYGRLEDVTAMDFLWVQLDTEFRKMWDTSATELTIIEENRERNSDLVYWKMQWPKPFANRDYVFQRRLTFDPKEGVCIISSVATEHPNHPVNRSMHRVTEYWSFIVVKPFTDFNKPGLQFVLTYFDNPGLSIPSSVANWVAATGLPSFVGKLRDAASRVAGLTPESEPALLHCLRQQLETGRANVLTAVERREEFGDGVTQPHQEETSTLLTVVGDTETDSHPTPTAPPDDTEADVDPPLSQESDRQSREASTDRVPLPVPSSPSTITPASAQTTSTATNVTPSSDNTQFLSSSQTVYA